MAVEFDFLAWVLLTQPLVFLHLVPLGDRLHQVMDCVVDLFGFISLDDNLATWATPYYVGHDNFEAFFAQGMSTG